MTNTADRRASASVSDKPWMTDSQYAAFQAASDAYWAEYANVTETNTMTETQKLRVDARNAAYSELLQLADVAYPQERVWRAERERNDD